MTGGSSRKRSGGRKRRRKRPNPAEQLTDDLLVEILSRVPYRSLRRFTCVSKRWRDLIAHPDHRRKLPQTLAGFFCHASTRCFVNASETGPPLVDPSLWFLPDREREGCRALLDGCNGLLLCRCFRFADPDEFDYLIINPATEKWVAVPVSRRWSNKVEMARLGFEPAVSSHFHVFEFQLNWDGDDDYGDAHVLGVKIYSSKTGLWSYKESGWEVGITLDLDFNSVFVDGILYVIATCCVIAAVDVEGKTWRIIDFPRSENSHFFDTDVGFIDLSKGKLHLANSDDITGDKLAIWVLEDRNSEDWTLKHTVSFRHLVGKKSVHCGYDEFIVVAIHPDRNMVFFVFGDKNKLMSYDMGSEEVRLIRILGHDCDEHCISYVPLFSEACVGGQQ
ncbi:hypothetical protein EJB05_01497, partial [Eragrostis curvula]